MKLTNKQYITKDKNIINYYETDSKGPTLLMIHGQGTNSLSFLKSVKILSKEFHIVLVDCYGHGKSSHNKAKYNLVNQGNDLIEFIQSISQDKISILGHSSGALISAYIASNSNTCNNLILEDGPFFTSCGERRYNTFNYLDLSTVCHNYINQNEVKDFPYYYFVNQYCWNYFPSESRDKIKTKLGDFALKYRTKNPNKNLYVPFWPKKFLEIFNGLNEYDPNFGETFYNNSFNFNIDYESLLSNISCPTFFMKANTTIAENGIVQGALTDEDLSKIISLIKNMRVKYFDCGHGIHIEKTKEFALSVISIKKQKIEDKGLEL